MGMRYSTRTFRWNGGSTPGVYTLGTNRSMIHFFNLVRNRTSHMLLLLLLLLLLMMLLLLFLLY